MYGRTYGLGFVAREVQRAVYTSGSGFAKQPVIATATPVPTVFQSGPKITPIKSTPLVIHPDFNVPEEMRFRYSDDQIREMLQRGKSETVERSGETDGGMPVETDLEQQSKESSATENFDVSAGNGPGYVTAPAKKVNLLPVILAGIAAYYLM